MFVAPDTGRSPERISPQEALTLLRDADTADLMARADRVKTQRHGADVHFVHSLNVNPTNICKNKCGLCAFWREADAEDAYSLDLSQIRDRLQQARAWLLKDLHVVGGLTEQMSLAYYVDFFKLAKQLLPETVIQGLTAVEIAWLARQAGETVDQTLAALKAAGLDAIPGGGAEIFSARVRDAICMDKISGETWLSIHAKAHALGMRSNATMLFGHIETAEEVVDHLTRLRDLQDQTRGFLAFCPLPFHTGGTHLGIEAGAGPTGHQITRIVAVSRLFLDNFSHIKVLANYLDRKLLQIMLFAGADDVGGTSMDERIAKAAGASEASLFTRPEEMSQFIKALGLNPVLTNSLYQGLAPAPSWSLADRMEDATWQALAQAGCGERVTPEQACLLHDQAPFYELGRIAHQRRTQVVGQETATYIIDRNISVTNVCVVQCKFCAFCRSGGHDQAFVMPIEEICRRVHEAVALGATQIMLQGGLNPDLDLSWYETMLRVIKTDHPTIWLHSLSPAEILWLGQGSGLSLGDTLLRLRKAGLDSLPGGGAEILVEAVRQRISPAKLTAAQWCEVMECAHGLGMSTTATMVYGFGETTEHRIEHFMRIRDLQDKTGGFRAFIPWSFQSNHTQLTRESQTGVDYLRIVALARLVLDNIPHIQAGWVTEGPDLAQMALRFGADDFGGVLMEESVVKATGIDFGMSVTQIKTLIRQAGFVPAQRDTLYGLITPCDAQADSSGMVCA